MKYTYGYPILPRRGLCNMLFTWARAVVYCHQHNAKMIAPLWARITRVGPWLRGERYKRYYGGELTNVGYVTGFKRWWILHFLKSSVAEFSGMDGFFEPFLADQHIVKKELLRIVNPIIRQAVQDIANSEPYIAVHIRRGDFRNAGLITPDEWYITAIDAALGCADKNMTIRVFTDGYPDEVSFVTRAYSNNNVIVMPNAPAIQDLLAMSNARVIVCSAESTFSMWAVFLGQKPSVWKKGIVVPRLYVGDDKMICA